MRVYVPATLPALHGWAADRTVVARHGYAVTPGLREWYAEGDLEELEWVAQRAAARAALRLLAADPGAPRRRVVLAVEVAAVADEATERGRVALPSAVPWTAVAAALVDGPEAAADVAAAASAVAAADAGDDDAAFAVDAADDLDLLWFATQEIAHIP